MCYFYLLLVPFYTVFVTKILALTDKYDQSPTCPKPEPRVATRPLPRPLYFWYLLVQFETYIVVTVYCPCESIKHQVVERCFQSSLLKSGRTYLGKFFSGSGGFGKRDIVANRIAPQLVFRPKLENKAVVAD